MESEISTPPAEKPEVQTPPPPAPVQTNQPAPPPAARLVVEGVKSEREIELEGLLAAKDETLTAAERRALEAERKAAEFERENQLLKEIPAPTAPKKVKREKPWYAPVIENDDDNDNAE